MADESDRIARIEVKLDHIFAQMDKVVVAVGLITKLQSDHDHHKEALGRAFDRITDGEKKYKDISEKLNYLDAKVSQYVWIGSGIGIGAAAVWIVVAWFIKNDVVSLLSAIAKAGGG